MQQLSEGNFWVGGRGVVVKELLKSIQKKALSCEVNVLDSAQSLMHIPARLNVDRTSWLL